MLPSMSTLCLPSSVFRALDTLMPSFRAEAYASSEALGSVGNMTVIIMVLMALASSSTVSMCLESCG